MKAIEDITQVFKNYEGKNMYAVSNKRNNAGKLEKDENGNPVIEEVELTLRSVITNALLNEEEKRPRTAEDKNRADQINRKVWAGKRIDLTLQERGYIIERVAIFYSPLILGRVEEILGGETSEEKKA